MIRQGLNVLQKSSGFFHYNFKNEFVVFFYQKRDSVFTNE